MILHKRKIGFTIAFLMVFIFGGVIGLFGVSYLYHKQVFPYVEANTAADLYRQIDMVSYLRLQKTDKVVDLLEAEIDRKILAVSEYTYIEEDHKNKVMGFAKAYREIYPSNSKNDSKVTNILKGFPEIELGKPGKCSGGLCHLAEHIRLQNGDNPAGLMSSD